MLVNKLDLTIAAQQDTEIVKPGDVPLQFHAIDQIDRNRCFAFADRIEKGVLEILWLLIHG